MDLGEVLVRDPRYVWRQRSAVLARHALVLCSAEAAGAEELELDGGWSCEAVVVSSAHPHAVRLRELRSDRELLVDTGSKGKRQMWIELFANARKSASAVAAPVARRSSPSRIGSATPLLLESDRSAIVGHTDALQLHQKTAEALAPVAGQLLRGEDVETLLLEHHDSLVTDARSTADMAASLVSIGMLEPLFSCYCGKEIGASSYTSDQIFRVKHQEVLAQLIAAPDASSLVVPPPESSPLHRNRDKRMRRRLNWSEDGSCQRLLQHFDRADNGLSGTEVVQALLQAGVFNVPTAVALADRMLQDGEIKHKYAQISDGTSFTMVESATYVRDTAREAAQLTLKENKVLALPYANQAEVVELEKRLIDMKSRHDNMFRILCAVCALMVIDTWLSSALMTSLMAGASITLLFMFVVRDGTATVAINFRDARGEQQIGGVVTAGFLSGTSDGTSARGAAEVDCTEIVGGKGSVKQSGGATVSSGASSTLSGSIHPVSATALSAVPKDVESHRTGVLSSVDQAKVLSFRQAIAQSANVPIDETQVFSDVYLLSVMSVKDRAFRYAVTKMAKILDWRRSYRVEKLTLASVDAEVKSRLAAGNMYWYGYDFQNRPILWVRAHLKNWANMATSREAEVRAHVFLIDLCCHELMPPGCTTFTIVSDASKISTTMVDLRLMHALLDTCVANYPDRIGMVHAGPLNRLLKYLTSALWPFLPVRLRSKVSFMRDCATELSKHMRFDLIPSYMGGPAEHELNARGDPTTLDIPFMLEAQKRRMQALNV